MVTADVAPESAISDRIPAGASSVGNRAVLVTLFVTILSSPFVLIEPSVYEVGILCLALACAFAGMPLNRKILPLFILMLIWGLSGAVALVPVLHDGRAVVYFLVSFYLQMSAVLFAWIFASDTMRRMDTLRTAYVVAAFAVAAIGVAGYFELVPLTDVLLEHGRVRATFKDPNVFAPFLILPMVFLLQSMLHERIRPLYVVAFVVMFGGLFLSFSRGAWAHFVISACVFLLVSFLTASTVRSRARIVAVAIMGAITVVGAIAVLLTLDSVSSMFNIRASLVQPYDVGPAGRFGRQIASLDILLDHPNGFGPEQFGRIFALAPHNVYLNAFFAYGWVGGLAFVTLMGTTLVYGFRALFVRTPWQPYLVAVYATFVGLLVEGLVIDSDHWRHFYLIVGATWGLVAATKSGSLRPQRRFGAQETTPSDMPAVPSPSPASPNRWETHTAPAPVIEGAVVLAPAREPSAVWKAYVARRNEEATRPSQVALARSKAAFAPAGDDVASAAPDRSAAAIVRKILFVTILASPLVFIEPSAYEAMVLVLAIACLATGISMSRYVLPMAVLLLAWALGGAIAVMPVLHDGQAVTYFLVSFYLQMTAILFACLLGTDTMRRLESLRAAYIYAAVFAAILGIVGYFQLVPGSDRFLLFGRARSTFKDPNVFGPFLILPLLFLIQDVLSRGLRVRYVLPAIVILIGLFLSFSRGAWGHLVASVLIMITIMFATAQTQRFRARLVTVSVAAAVLVAVMLLLMLSLGTVQDMFTQRASLVQSYDGGSGGRFATQVKSLLDLLDHPNGYGPEQFATIFGLAPHNAYINGFAAYGWLGGMMYLVLTLITIFAGFRATWVRTPWQPYTIAVYACYLALAGESMIIDTDHWRHYFLLLGVLWGLIAVTKKAQVAVSVGGETRPSIGGEPIAAALQRN